MEHSSKKLITLLSSCIEKPYDLERLLYENFEKTGTYQYFRNRSDTPSDLLNFENRSVQELYQHFYFLESLKNTQEEATKLLKDLIPKVKIAQLNRLNEPDFFSLSALQGFIKDLKALGNPLAQTVNYTNLGKVNPFLFFKFSTVTSLESYNFEMDFDTNVEPVVAIENLVQGSLFVIDVQEFHKRLNEFNHLQAYRKDYREEYIGLTTLGNNTLRNLQPLNELLNSQNYTAAVNFSRTNSEVLQQFLNLKSNLSLTETVHLIRKGDMQFHIQAVEKSINEKLQRVAISKDFTSLKKLLDHLDTNDINQMVNLNKSLIALENERHGGNFYKLGEISLTNLLAIKDKVKTTIDPNKIVTEIEKGPIAVLKQLFNDSPYVISNEEFYQVMSELKRKRESSHQCITCGKKIAMPFRKQTQKCFSHRSFSENISLLNNRFVKAMAVIFVLLIGLLSISPVRLFFLESVNGFGIPMIQSDISEKQYVIGKEYLEGIDRERDYEKGLKWSLKAAENGHPIAQVNVGLIYENGLGVEQDYEEAFQWFTKATDQGNSLGMMMQATHYYLGKAVPVDMNKAFELIQKAVEMGIDNQVEMANALAVLGTFYEEQSDIVETDLETAFNYYLQAAELGNEKAIGWVAEMYAEGKGVQQDLEKANYWSEQLTEN